MNVWNAHAQWNLARRRYRLALTEDGERGPIARSRLRELIMARTCVRRAIASAREEKRKRDMVTVLFSGTATVTFASIDEAKRRVGQ